jgi:ATP-binding cassette, subfamily B, bacterial
MDTSRASDPGLNAAPCSDPRSPENAAAPRLMRFVALSDEPVDSKRIQVAVTPTSHERGVRALRAYWMLQPGRWWEWTAIWLLQNLRFAPIYLLPLMTGHLIDLANRGAGGEALSFMPLFAGATLGLCLLNVLGDTSARLLLSRISRSLTAGLRGALIRRLNRLSMHFHDREKIGEIEGRFTIDLNRLEAFQTFVADGLLMNASVMMVMGVIIFVTNPLLLGVIFLGVVVNLVLVRFLWRHLTSAQQAYRHAEGAFLHRLGEALQALRISRAHATEGFVERRLQAGAREVARKGLVIDFLMNLFGSSSWALSTVLNTAVVMLGVWLILIEPLPVTVAGWTYTIQPITIGQFTVLLSYYGIITGATTAIINHVPSVTGAVDAIRSLAGLYREEDEAPNGVHTLPRLQGDIRLHGVSFAYPGAEGPVLDGLDLHIPAGRTIALVGPSGGGKSTIANLILGFYRPHAGRITIDGIDLGDVDLQALRRQVGVVSQEVVLFNDTILANIAWGDAKPDRRRAREAARLANAMEFISKLPGGLDHELGDRGAGLSGGQRQRLAIARALYRDPRILVLDEATSALDPASEQLVQQALEQARHGRTTLIIAHRLTTVRHADLVAVVADGVVKESGTHEELVRAGGMYERLVAAQTEELQPAFALQ